MNWVNYHWHSFIFLLTYCSHSPNPKNCLLITQVIAHLPAIALALGTQRDMVIGHMPFPYNEPKWWAIYKDWMDKRRYETNMEEQFAMSFAGNVYEFLKTRDIYCKVCIYEDIKKDAKAEITDLFQKINLDTKYVPLALDMMGKDSQKGVLGKPGNDHVTIPQSTWDSVNAIWKQYDVPVTAQMTAEEYEKVILHYKF